MVVQQGLVHLEVEKLASIGYAKVYINNIGNKSGNGNFFPITRFYYINQNSESKFSRHNFVLYNNATYIIIIHFPCFLFFF